MKSNYNLIKNILFVALGAVLFITSLVLFIQSFSAYGDEYGSGFDANLDYVVAMIISLIILFAAIYNLVKKDIKNILPTVTISIALISSGYSLGLFIKKLVKGGKFVDYQTYFYFGIVALILLAIGVFQYLINKSKNND